MAQLNDSEPFQVSLFPVGGGQHCMRIKAKVRQQTKTQTGDSVRVRFSDLDRADVTIPDDLMAALRAADLIQAFESLPPGKQNFLVRRMNEAARPETRAKRIEAVLKAAQPKRGA